MEKDPRFFLCVRVKKLVWINLFYSLKDSNLMEMNRITVKEKVTYLGVFIDDD